mmetsp:Transcript_41415/g.88255  ORF Transcript_41415/g.88255 Transcript_41415/m.88255 type:complete len:245 (-) Transcript_41415:991-1725(-)
MTSILGGCDRHPIRLSIIHLHRASRFTSHRSFFTAHRANGSSSLQLGTISPDSRRSARVSSLPSPLSTPSQKEGQGQAVMSADRFISLAKAPCIDFRNAGPPADDVASPRTSDVCSSISFNDEPPRSSLIRSSVFRFQPRCGGGPCRGCFPPWPSHSQSSLQTKPRMRARASAGSLSTSSSEIVSMAVCADTSKRGVQNKMDNEEELSLFEHESRKKSRLTRETTMPPQNQLQCPSDGGGGRRR